jgi:hypothetical protein
MSVAFCSVYIAANPQVIPSGTWTNAQFDLVIPDGVTTIYNPTTYMFTVPISGWYKINLQLCWDSAGLGSSPICGIRFIRNNQITMPEITVTRKIEVNDGVTMYLEHFARFNATETFFFQVYQNSGGSLDVLNVNDPSGGSQPGRCTNGFVNLVQPSTY